MNINDFKEQTKKVLTHLDNSFSTIRAVGAHPSMLSSVMVNYYGAMTPINQCASIIAQGGTSLIVTPFDKNLIKEVLSAINASNLGLNGVNDGDKIRISVPLLNQEKRELFCKEAKEHAEKSRIALRNVRHDFLHKIKEDKTLREDERKSFESDVQKEIDKVNKVIEDKLKEKTTSLMKV